jgi:hypothetical protein
MKSTALIGISLAMAACGASREAVVAKAASDLHCDAAMVTAEGVPGHGGYLHASGCGKENWYINDGGSWVSPLDRASFEMSCPKDQMKATSIDKTTIGVEGCGKKGVYLMLVSGPGRKKWVLNSSEDSRPPAK